MNRVRKCGTGWRVLWKGKLLAPIFNSQGAAYAFLDGLYKGRKPV